MSSSLFFVDDLEIRLYRKPIKNIYLSVRPPDGQVVLSVPLKVSEAELVGFVTSKIGWIHNKQHKIQAFPLPEPYRMESGEMHTFSGRRYPLRCTESCGRASVAITADGVLEICSPPGTGVEERHLLLENWYRARLKEKITGLLQYWEKQIGIPLNAWGVKRMKTRWGSCNTVRRRIWLNLELVKEPEECLEYVIVHELVHLHERYHNKRFYGLLSSFLPDWERRRALLRETL